MHFFPIGIFHVFPHFFFSWRVKHHTLYPVCPAPSTDFGNALVPLENKVPLAGVAWFGRFYENLARF